MGEAVGPKLQLNFNVMDVKSVFVGAKSSYEVRNVKSMPVEFGAVSLFNVHTGDDKTSECHCLPSFDSESFHTQRASLTLECSDQVFGSIALISIAPPLTVY